MRSPPLTSIHQTNPAGHAARRRDRSIDGGDRTTCTESDTSCAHPAVAEVNAWQTTVKIRSKDAVLAIVLAKPPEVFDLGCIGAAGFSPSPSPRRSTGLVNGKVCCVASAHAHRNRCSASCTTAGRGKRARSRRCSTRPLARFQWSPVFLRVPECARRLTPEPPSKLTAHADAAQPEPRPLSYGEQLTEQWAVFDAGERAWREEHGDDRERVWEFL